VLERTLLTKWESLIVEHCEDPGLMGKEEKQPCGRGENVLSGGILKER